MLKLILVIALSGLLSSSVLADDLASSNSNYQAKYDVPNYNRPYYQQQQQAYVPTSQYNPNTYDNTYGNNYMINRPNQQYGAQPNSQNTPYQYNGMNFNNYRQYMMATRPTYGQVQGYMSRPQYQAAYGTNGAYQQQNNQYSPYMNQQASNNNYQAVQTQGYQPAYQNQVGGYQQPQQQYGQVANTYQNNQYQVQQQQYSANSNNYNQQPANTYNQAPANSYNQAPANNYNQQPANDSYNSNSVGTYSSGSNYNKPAPSYNKEYAKDTTTGSYAAKSSYSKTS